MLPLTGHTEIDNDHQKLETLLKDLIESLKTPPDYQILLKKFQTFGNAAIQHFDFEDFLMKKHQYPYYENHSYIHSLEITEFVSLLAKMTTNNLPFSEQQTFLDELTQWLYSHITNYDTDLAQFLLSIGK